MDDTEIKAWLAAHDPAVLSEEDHGSSTIEPQAVLTRAANRAKTRRFVTSSSLLVILLGMTLSLSIPGLSRHPASTNATKPAAASINDGASAAAVIDAEAFMAELQHDLNVVKQLRSTIELQQRVNDLKLQKQLVDQLQIRNHCDQAALTHLVTQNLSENH